MPSEKYVFTTRVEPISSPIGGDAGYRPRVHNDYSTHRLSPLREASELYVRIVNDSQFPRVTSTYRGLLRFYHVTQA
jgi:hypothetical protein